MRSAHCGKYVRFFYCEPLSSPVSERAAVVSPAFHDGDDSGSNGLYPRLGASFYSGSAMLLARPSQLDPEITNFCRREDENASPIKGRHFEVGCSVDQGSFRIADFS